MDIKCQECEVNTITRHIKIQGWCVILQVCGDCYKEFYSKGKIEMEFKK